VSGRVLDYQTNVPVSARVVFSGRTAVTTSTDGAGFYSVTLPAGTYTNAGKFDGQLIDGTTIAIGAQRTVDFLVNPGNCFVWYGTILDSASGRPIAGATATWFGANGISVTGSDGVYRVSPGCLTAPFPYIQFGVGTSAFQFSAPGYRTLNPL